jgi:putative DNA-invertase from lambdoid prophage Rac
MLRVMLAAFAKMERDLIMERTQAGLARARAQRGAARRPSKTSENDRTASACDWRGDSVSTVARSCHQQGVPDCDTEGSAVVVR